MTAKRSEVFRAIYSNQVTFAVSDMDISLSFLRNEPVGTPPTASLIEETLVQMPLPTAKQFFIKGMEAIEAQEKVTGPINAPIKPPVKKSKKN